MKIAETDGWIYLGNTDERYILGQPGRRNMLVFGVNPSTAVPGKDDPTIRKVRKLTAEAGYDGWIMGNLYPVIASHPKDLPHKPEKKLLSNNLKYLKQIQDRYPIDAVWAAWGDAIDCRPYLGKALVDIQEKLDGDFEWFRRGTMTRKGNPRHPLYMKEGELFIWFPVFDYATYYTDW